MVPKFEQENARDQENEQVATALERWNRILVSQIHDGPCKIRPLSCTCPGHQAVRIQVQNLKYALVISAVYLFTKGGNGTWLIYGHWNLHFPFISVTICLSICQLVSTFLDILVSHELGCNRIHLVLPEQNPPHLSERIIDLYNKYVAICPRAIFGIVTRCN